jgi:hypothetical protein
MAKQKECHITASIWVVTNNGFPIKNKLKPKPKDKEDK